MAGPLARLNVFECRVKNGLPGREWMADIPEHLHAAGADIDFAALTTDGSHQLASLLQGSFARCEAGHGDAKNSVARQLHRVHGACADDQRLRGIKAARHADDGTIHSCSLKAFREPLNLDFVHLAAAVVPADGFARDI